MTSCDIIDPLVTPYVDDELDAGERARVDEHLRRCPPCHERVAAERTVRVLIQARKPAFHRECASPGLRTACASLRSRADDSVRGAALPPARVWRTRLAPFALAASVVVLVGGAFVYQVTDRSTSVMAADTHSGSPSSPPEMSAPCSMAGGPST